MNIQYSKIIDWFVVNDINSFKHYKEKLEDSIKKKQLLHWNCLSISNRLLEFIKKYNPVKTYDVCFIGYAYPSRQNFLKKLLPIIKNGKKICIIGSGYNFLDTDIAGVDIYDTMNEIETAKLAMQSKIILIKHRGENDCGGLKFIEIPKSINRGYIEAAYKAVLLIDSDRTYHSFDNNTVLAYKDVNECVIIINDILKNYDTYLPNVQKLYNKAIQKFTYRTRLMKVLNCIRSVRYNKIIE